MAFEPDPTIIGFFPLLVTIPAIVTFLIMLEVRHRSIQPDTGHLPITRKHIVRGMQLVVLVPYLGIFGTVVVALVLNVEIASFWLTVLQFVAHTTLSMLIGVVAGMVLVAAYGYRGVSAFTVAACMMCVPSIIVLGLGVPGLVVSYMLDGLDTLAPFLVLFNSGCALWPLKWIFGEPEVTDHARAEATRQIVSNYVLEVIRILQGRSAFSDDPLAEKILERFLQTGGPTGDFIRATEEKGNIRSSTESIRYRYSPSSELKHFLPVGNWTLTAPQFRRRVLIDRAVFSASAIGLAALCLYFASDLSVYTNQWSLVLFLGVLVSSVPLAVFDQLFRGTRDDVEKTVALLTAPLRGIEEVLTVETDVSPHVDSEATTETERASEEPPAVTLSPDFIKQQKPSLHFFLNRVAEGKDDVYEESVRFLPLGAVVVLMLGASIAVLVITWFHYQSLFLSALMLFVGVLVPLSAAGLVWWRSMIKRVAFRGCRRSWLSLALSYLDAKESGHDNFGLFVPIPNPPGQFVFLSLGGPNASRGILRKLRSETGLKVPASLERKSLEVEMRMTKPVLMIYLIVLAAISLPVLLLPETFLVLLALDLLMLLVLPFVLYSHLRNRRRLRRIESETSLESDTEQIETVPEVLRLMKSEYSHPLRLLTVRAHQELLFTGRTYLTTAGVRFREAVFIPSTSNGRSR